MNKRYVSFNADNRSTVSDGYSVYRMADYAGSVVLTVGPKPIEPIAKDAIINLPLVLLGSGLFALAF